MACSSKPQMKLLQDTGADECAVLPTGQTGAEMGADEKEAEAPVKLAATGQIPAANSAK